MSASRRPRAPRAIVVVLGLTAVTLLGMTDRAVAGAAVTATIAPAPPSNTTVATPPPTARPTPGPTARPTPGPTTQPTAQPTTRPTAQPTPGRGRVVVPLLGPPLTPAAPTAVARANGATVTWVAPGTNGLPLLSYVITPVRNGVAQTAQTFDTSTTTRTLTGLTPMTPYTFLVAATNLLGTGPNSPPSNTVIPYTLPGAPTITSVGPGSGAAVISWTAPSDGGSAITSYQIRPFIGGVAQTARLFLSSPTTQTVTGLTAGTAYTFQVAAINAAGTGPASASSGPVTPNPLPSLSFPAPSPGEVGAAYSDQLAVTGGTAPFAWSISAGALPAGLSLNPTTGLLSGTPSVAGTFSFTVRVVDASTVSALEPVVLVIVAGPSLSIPPPPVGKAYDFFSDQLTVTGGTAPFAWSVTSGTLPAGLSLNPVTGLLSGTPTDAGTFPVTVTVTDAFNRGASQMISLLINPLAGLSIVVPGAAVFDPVDSASGSTTGQLGVMMVSDDRGPASGFWTATVSITDFTTGGGSPAETIPGIDVVYSSGPALQTTGVGTFIPQPAAVLSDEQFAAGWSGQGSTNSASWNPTLEVTLPSMVIAGEYTAILTTSVA
ncbi:hypothetical protein GCM10023322_65150 [Rugosimonospora acidiphila]|uniref:Fibronectin type-III domain-containing protein n=1 Tax=Rugosimonospora acidiphila TaxID=556531 RepID=A0ABP9SJK6_9ACTN